MHKSPKDDKEHYILNCTQKKHIEVFTHILKPLFFKTYANTRKRNRKEILNNNETMFVYKKKIVM